MSPPGWPSEASYHAASSHKDHSHGPGSIRPEDWSSLIGIVTAIVGNVLISFALNTQRYAHIRIARDVKSKSKNAVNGGASHAGHGANGTDGGSGSASATRLVKQQKASRQPARASTESSADASRETDALLPKDHDHDTQSVASASASSDSGDDEKTDGAQPRKNYLKSPIWWIGIVLMVVGEAGNFLAYGFAPASIVSPLGVVALISNCLIAPIMLKEKFRKRDLLGVIVAVGGAVTVVLSAKDSNPKLGPGQIWSLIKRWEFLTYLGITVALIIVMMLASNRYGHKSIMVDIGLVGLFGGYTALSTKGVASLFSSKLFEVFGFPITYLLALVLVFTAVMQIKYVNRALQRFDSTQVIPTQFVTFTIFVVVGSAVLYRDFEKTAASDVGKFIGGVAMTFLGVWCITSGRSRESSEDVYSRDEEQGVEEDEEEEEEEEPTTPTLKATRSAPDSSRDYADSPASFATAASRIPSSPSKALSQQRPTHPHHPSKSTPALTPKRPSTHRPAPKTPAQQKPDPRPFSPTRTNSDTTLTQSSSHLHTPQTPGSVPRHVLNRHSIAGGLTPGPYLSPLSSGLSVVVADSLRRSDSTGSRPRVRSRSLRQPRPDQARTSSLPDASLGADIAALRSGLEPSSAEARVAANLGPHDGELERPGLGARGATVEVASSAVVRRAAEAEASADDWDDGLMPTQSNRATF